MRVFLITFLGALIYASPSGAPSSELVSITLHSTDPQIFTKLRIPADYIETPTLQSLGQVGEFLSLEMKYPEMSPLAPYERTRDFSFVRPPAQDRFVATGNYLKIEIHQGRLHGIETLIRSNIADRWLPEPDDPQHPGFTVYSDRVMKTEELKGYPILTRYYVPRSAPSNEHVYFQCATNPRSDDNRLLCQSSASFDNLLYGGYYFSKSRLNEWQTIDAAVRTFLKMIISSGDRSR